MCLRAVPSPAWSAFPSLFRPTFSPSPGLEHFLAFDRWNSICLLNEDAVARVCCRRSTRAGPQYRKPADTSVLKGIGQFSDVLKRSLLILGSIVVSAISGEREHRPDQ